ncbi:MAG: septum formation inhibitor Maf [Gammaproteobacteria bacterium]|jgi:septum formation protein|nr:septum formation inhibitor Maf [Gammaproteobacteria bacterium]MBT7370641.1 septum formation inhibitor Maf [Gammaproteobacteria bacterium]
MNDLILASGSPRRSSLLRQAGLTFVVVKPDIDERVLKDEQAGDYVTRLSREKAIAVSAQSSPSSVVIAADTTVVISGTILGKPESKSDGLAMLKALSGSKHQVLTGVSVIRGREDETFCVSSDVQFRRLSAAEMEWYWQTGEPSDKAGGYGLQGIGAAFVSSINGSYTNVIGLPLAETILVLRHFGILCLGEAEVREREILNIRDSSYV